MTNEEAIKILKKEYLGDSEEMELAKYMGWNALEKQIPKKPKRNNTIASKFFHKTFCYTCPACGNGLLTKMMNERQNTRFCWDCGQRLDWTEGEEA